MWKLNKNVGVLKELQEMNIVIGIKYFQFFHFYKTRVL
jgi:hypothetical protein